MILGSKDVAPYVKEIRGYLKYTHMLTPFPVELQEIKR